MSEQEMPKMIIQTGDGDFESTPMNTSLFNFTGRLAMYDHVFFNTDGNSGIYLFNQHHSYQEVADFMIEHEYPMHLFLTHVAECDLNAFDSMVKQDVNDLEKGVPDEWT